MIIFTVIIVILSISLFIYLVVIKKVQIEASIESLYNNQEYEKIISIIENNKSLIDKSLKIKFIYGLTLCDIGNVQEGFILLKNVEKNFKEDYGINYSFLLETLGKCAFTLQLYKDSFYYFYKLLKEDPKNKTALYYVARIYAGANRYNAAILLYEDLKKIDDKNFNVYFDLGLLNLHHGKISNALKYFKIANELNKHNKEALYFYGLCLILIGRLENAIELFNNIKDSPDLKSEFKTDCLRLLGNIYQKMDITSYAIKSYEEFLINRKFTIKEFVKDVLYNLGIAYIKIKDTKNGIKAIKLLHSIDPHYKDVQDILYKENYIFTDPAFIEMLSKWNELVEIKIPFHLIRQKLLLAKNLDLSDIEAEFGIINKEEKEIKNFISYKNARYQDWIIVNEALLREFGFKNIKRYKIENDPDIVDGKAVYYSAEKFHNRKKFKFLIKFYRGEELSKNILKDFILIKESLPFEKGAVITTANINTSILNFASKRDDLIIYSKHEIIDALSKI